MFKTILEINEEIKSLNKKINVVNEILIDFRTQSIINNNYQELNNELNKYEYQVYSQNGEDGLINEILRRLDIKNGTFVEIGVQNGLETNTTYLLMQGWKGLWIEADNEFYEQIETTFRKELLSKDLALSKNFVNCENIEAILDIHNLPVDFEVLSIDIDSNDYWIWKKIEKYNPKVVVIEYNAFFPSSDMWIMDYDPEKTWDSSTVFNASLRSLNNLANEKGYQLVACSINGVNAFFIRKDLINDRFKILELDEIYHPIRYYLKRDFTIFKGFQKQGNV